MAWKIVNDKKEAGVESFNEEAQEQGEQAAEPNAEERTDLEELVSHVFFSVFLKLPRSQGKFLFGKA